MGAQDLPNPRWGHWSSKDGGNSTKSPSLGPSIAGFVLSQACSPTSGLQGFNLRFSQGAWLGRGWDGMGWDGIRSLGFVCSIPSLLNLDFNRLKFKAYLCLVVSLCLLWQVQR